MSADVSPCLYIMFYIIYLASVPDTHLLFSIFGLNSIKFIALQLKKVEIIIVKKII